MSDKADVDNIETLIAAAWTAREHAYVPYSRFAVGAALRCSDGTVFTGSNVENISFGLTLCAERVAVTSAAAAGRRTFSAIAIAAASREPISPCGACRQVLAEFAPSLLIISVNQEGARFEATLDFLLPRAKSGILDWERST